MSQLFAQTRSTVFENSQFGKWVITSSSTLAAQTGSSYAPKNIADGNNWTAWIEGKRGDGIGEWIMIEFDSPHIIGSAYVMNGYGKNAHTFKGNNRIKTALIETDEGAFEATLPDTVMETKIKFPSPVNTKMVKLTIKSVYPGEKWKDTALGEFRPDLEEYN